jgi:O-antigen/teichoic acid export membrane protein
MAGMKDNMRRLLHRVPLQYRESGVVLMGDVVSKFLTFLITLMLFKLVSPADYALYGMFITLMATLNQFTDSGIHSSFIRFYALYRIPNPERAAAYLHFSFRLKSVLMVATGIAVFFGAPLIAGWIFKMPRLTGGVRLLGFGVMTSGFFEFYQIVFMAQQRYGSLTALRMSEAVGKVAFIAAAVWLHAFSLDVVYSAYIAVPFVISLGAMAAYREPFRSVPYAAADIRKEMYAFGKWIMLSSFMTMFLLRLDVFMLAPMLSESPAELGYYNAAVRLCIPLLVIAGSVGTVLFPKAMALSNYGEMKEYVRHSFRLSVPLALAGAVYWLLVVLAIPRWFPSYGESIVPFSILCLGYEWTIVGNPITTLILSMDRPKVSAIINLAQLFLTVISHYILITLCGAIGAAVSTVLMWFIAGTVSMLYVYRHRFSINALHTVRRSHAPGDFPPEGPRAN